VTLELLMLDVLLLVSETWGSWWPDQPSNQKNQGLKGFD
jgi:hypothetical protein